MSDTGGVVDPEREPLPTSVGGADLMNVRTALMRGQFQLIAPTTEAGATGLVFPGVAIGEQPTGGAAGQLRWRNADDVPVRIRKLYLSNADADITQAFMLRFRIANQPLHSGFIHSGTVSGRLVCLSLGEGFLVFPGDTLFVDSFAQVPVPVPMTFRMVLAGRRIINWANLPVGTTAAELAGTIKALNQQGNALDSRRKMADAYQRDLRRRWWSMVNGVGEVGGVGNDVGVYGFGAVDLVTNTQVISGFENEQSGPFVWETILFYCDPQTVAGGGFAIAQIETSDDQFISPQGGPIRSDTLQTTPDQVGNVIVVPYVLDTPLVIESKQSVRITFQQAPGLAPARVWMFYGGTLDGDPYR